MHVDPSGHTWLDTVKGLISGVAESVTYGASNSFESGLNISSKEDYYNGKVMGNLTVALLSEGGTGGGLTLSLSGFGSVVGVPAIAYSKSVQL